MPSEIATRTPRQADQGLREATEQEIVSRLLVMFAGLPQTSVGDQSDARLAAYLMALQGCSLGALEQGIHSVMQGTAGIDERWCPTPPQMSTIVRRIDGGRQKAQEREHERREMKQLPRPVVSEEARRRSQRLFEEYLASVPGGKGLRRLGRPSGPVEFDEEQLKRDLAEMRAKAPHSSLSEPEPEEPAVQSEGG
jgi:hypothetical protein